MWRAKHMRILVRLLVCSFHRLPLPNVPLPIWDVIAAGILPVAILSLCSSLIYIFKWYMDCRHFRTPKERRVTRPKLPWLMSGGSFSDVAH
jgi:hypothetical protein